MAHLYLCANDRSDTATVFPVATRLPIYSDSFVYFEVELSSWWDMHSKCGLYTPYASDTIPYGSWSRHQTHVLLLVATAGRAGSECWQCAEYQLGWYGPFRTLSFVDGLQDISRADWTFQGWIRSPPRHYCELTSGSTVIQHRSSYVIRRWTIAFLCQELWQILEKCSFEWCPLVGYHSVPNAYIQRRPSFWGSIL